VKNVKMAVIVQSLGLRFLQDFSSAKSSPILKQCTLSKFNSDSFVFPGSKELLCVEKACCIQATCDI